jgi:hypothetical protein
MPVSIPASVDLPVFYMTPAVIPVFDCSKGLVHAALIVPLMTCL